MASELEGRYRQSFLAADVKQAKLGILLLVIPVVLYLFNDFQFFGLSQEFFGLSALRLGFLVFTVWLLTYFSRLKSFRSYDKAVFAWGLAGIIIATLLNASRPQNFLFHAITVIAIIVVTYLVIPQKLVPRIVLALAASIGEVVIIMLDLQSLTTPALFSVTFSLAFANVIGFSTSRLMESYRFKTFQAHEEIADLAKFPLENPNPVMRISKDNVILYANPAAEQLFGKLEVKIGKPLLHFIKADFSLQGEAEVEHDDKTFLFYAAPMTDAGYFDLYARDITRLKKNEALLVLHEMRLQSMLDLNKMLDASEQELVDFALEAINKVTSSEFAFIGLLNEDETVMTIQAWSKTVMKECNAINKPIHYPLSQAGVWAEAIRQRKPVFIDDYSAVISYKKGLPEGHVPIKRYLGVPVFEKDQIVAIASVANKNNRYTELDAHSVTTMITDMWRLIQRKRTEEELKESSRKIEIMNEKLRVSGNLARHDVRNKLAAITGYSYLLKKRHSEQADIIDALSKMEQAVKDSVKIFDFAKMYEQLGLEELQYVNAEETINEATALFPGLNFKVINDCHGLSLLADSFLRQLFYNFIDNTKKYGKKTTKVRVYYEKTGQDTLQLIYEDDGVGISKENKLKLFIEGFSTGGSTGFGLFLIKRMMDVYGWTIQETGEAYKGVKFVITIPKVSQSGKENYQINESRLNTQGVASNVLFEVGQNPPTNH